MYLIKEKFKSEVKYLQGDLRSTEEYFSCQRCEGRKPGSALEKPTTIHRLAQVAVHKRYIRHPYTIHGPKLAFQVDNRWT